VSHWVNEGINFLKKGNLVEAERALRIAVKEDGRNVEAWLWLSQAVESDAEKMTCLLKVLEMDPRNIVARQSLATLQQRSRVDGGQHVDPFEMEDAEQQDNHGPYSTSDSPFAIVSGVDEESKNEPVKESPDYLKFLVIGLLLVMVIIMIFLLATIFK
jgi:hypothetical protein